jgi:hypothetical protein
MWLQAFLRGRTPVSGRRRAAPGLWAAAWGLGRSLSVAAGPAAKGWGLDPKGKAFQKGRGRFSGAGSVPHRVYTIKGLFQQGRAGHKAPGALLRLPGDPHGKPPAVGEASLEEGALEEAAVEEAAVAEVAMGKTPEGRNDARDVPCSRECLETGSPPGLRRPARRRCPGPRGGRLYNRW